MHGTGKHRHGFCLGCLFHKCMELLPSQVRCPQKLLLDISLVKCSLLVRKLQRHPSLCKVARPCDGGCGFYISSLDKRKAGAESLTIPFLFSPARRVQSKGYFCPYLLAHPISLKKVIRSPHQPRTGLQNMPLVELTPLSFMMRAEF